MRQLTSLLLLLLASTLPAAAQAPCGSAVNLRAPGLPEADRLDVLATLQNQTTCSPEELADKARLLVRDLGYFKATTDVPTVDTQSSTITISVTPGAPYHLGELTIHGNQSLSSD